jgi:hypothetical protein
MVLESKTHSKKTKKKKFFKTFFVFVFLNVFVKHEPLRVLRKQGFVIPRGPWALTFLIHKHIQKRQRKKNFLKLFSFLFFWMCLWNMNLWECWGNRSSWFREVLEPWMVYESKTHSKKTKKKNFLKLFSFLFFWMCLWFKNPWECWGNRGSWFREVLEPWMVYESKTHSKKTSTFGRDVSRPEGPRNNHRREGLLLVGGRHFVPPVTNHVASQHASQQASRHAPRQSRPKVADC